MNIVSQIIVLSYVFSVSFSSHAASSDIIISLAGNVSENEVQLDESTRRKELVLRIGDPLRVIVENVSDFDIILPAAPSACAVITIERYNGDTWQNWSNCTGRGQVKNPTLLVAGQSIDGTRSFRVTRPTSKAEVLEGPLGSQSDLPTKENLQGPTRQIPLEKEVQQTINTVQQPVPFFEKFRTLPAGNYQLAASYAFSGRPEEIRYVKSMPFSVIDRTNGQN